MEFITAIEVGSPGGAQADRGAPATSGSSRISGTLFRSQFHRTGSVFLENMTMSSPFPLKESPPCCLHVAHIGTLRQACALELVVELSLNRAGEAMPSDALVQLVSFKTS